MVGYDAETLELSVVSPAHDEEANVRPLVAEICDALEPLGIDFEIVIVDDGSTDGTANALRAMQPERPRLRVIRMADTPPGKGHGQSAAFHAGVRAARGRLIAMMDADLQNNPADLPRMITLMNETSADMVHGDRTHARKDSLGRKASSIVGRLFRRMLLGDTIRDTGCSLRILKREIALQLPLEFRGMHRFIPVSVRQMGYKVVETRVDHRPRVAGEAKYGVFNRAIPGFFDCLAARWMFKRRRPVRYTVIDGGQSEPPVAEVNKRIVAEWSRP